MKLFKKTVLYVARTDNEGNYRNSAPCLSCFNIIKELNIKKIVFSIENDFCVYKTSDYHTDHVSQGNRYLRNRSPNYNRKNQVNIPTPNSICVPCGSC